MTNEEAISALKNTAWIGTDKKVGEVEKAIMMAVEALKGQLLREDATKDTTNNDIISRQAAIDALGEEPEVWSWKDEYEQGLNNQWHYDVNALKALSSAQPEEDCDTCKHGYFGDDKCNNCRVRYPSHYERRTDD